MTEAEFTRKIAEWTTLIAVMAALRHGALRAARPIIHPRFVIAGDVLTDIRMVARNHFALIEVGK